MTEFRLRVLFLLSQFGVALSTIWLLLPHEAAANEAAIIAVLAVFSPLSFVLFRVSQSRLLPAWVPRAYVGAGLVGAALLVYFAQTGPGFGFFDTWLVVFTFSLDPKRIAIPLSIAAWVTYTIALVALYLDKMLPSSDVIPRSLMMAGTIAALGVLIRWVRDLADEESRGRHRAERLMSNIVTSSDDAILSKTREGIVTSWNPGAEKLYGYTAEEAIGEHISLVIPPEHQGEEQRIIDSVLAGHGVDHFETARVTKDGQHLTVEVTASPIEVDGEITGIAVTTRDMTAHRAMEKELGYVRRMEAVGQLASGAAHDFNHTLGIVKNYLTLLERDLPEKKSPRVTDDLIVMREAVGQGEKLASQLATLGRKSNNGDGERYRMCFNDVLMQLKSLLRFETDEIEVQYDLAPACPDICMDPTQIEQIIFNLAINARDAVSANNGRGAKVIFRTRMDDEYAYLDVIDNGIGFSDEAAEHAFDPFYTTKTRAQGTGLGLSTVYGLVKAAGGRVDIANNPDGRGATVTVAVPRVND